MYIYMEVKSDREKAGELSIPLHHGKDMQRVARFFFPALNALSPLGGLLAVDGEQALASEQVEVALLGGLGELVPGGGLGGARHGGKARGVRARRRLPPPTLRYESIVGRLCGGAQRHALGEVRRHGLHLSIERRVQYAETSRVECEKCERSKKMKI